MVKKSKWNANRGIKTAVVAYKGAKRVKTFKSVTDAAQWCIDTEKSNAACAANLTSRISKSTRDGSTVAGLVWVLWVRK